MIPVVVQRFDDKGKPETTIVFVDMIISLDNVAQEAIRGIKETDRLNGHEYNPNSYITNKDKQYYTPR